MPPKKTIFVDADRVLLVLFQDLLRRELAVTADHQNWLAEKESPAGKKTAAALREGWKAYFPGEPYREFCRDLQNELQSARDQWSKYELLRFAGCDHLTESEKQQWRQAIRDLERQGLVEIAGIRASEIRLSETGRQRAQELIDTPTHGA